MKRREAAKYARWSATAALFLASLTAGVYLERKWVAHREKEKAPPPAPRDVSQLMNGITFSKVEGNQKIFTVEAQRATDFRDKSTSLMEDVSITIFGKTGGRHDTIHTQSCQYEKDGGSIVCSGEVQLDLQSAADAQLATGSPGTKTAQKVHVETRGVTFNRATGLAQSDQPVKFVFPNGKGEAIGVEYRSEDGAIALLRDVNFFLLPSATSGVQPASGTSPHDPVHVTGKSIDFGRDSRLLHLRGPVEAQTGTARLLAGELTLALNKTFHAEKLVAARGANAKNPEVESRGKDSQTDLSGQTLTAYFAPEGWLTRIEGAGGVQGSQRSETDSDDFSAETASLESEGECAVKDKSGKNRRIENTANRRPRGGICRTEKRPEQQAGPSGDPGQKHSRVDRSGATGSVGCNCGRNQLVANDLNGRQARAGIRGRG